MGKVAPLFEIIYQTVQDERNDISVETLCEIAGVSRSGYYAWVAAIPERKKREEEDRADFKLILIAYNKRGYTKGARGIYMCLLHMEPPIIMNLKKIRRLRYPLAIPHPPKLSVIQKKPEKLGKKKDSDAEKSADDKCS